ncbi:MAG: flagellar assembly protein FliW [Nitrospiraceae bacterium]|nr:MAG: flagellar assembly protein FliW [Nitrospiraceae bacterium]
MKLKTSRFGELEVEEEKIISFADGLVGLSGMKQFILVDHRDTPLKWLQSVDDPDIAFIVATPDTMKVNLSLELDNAVRQHLQLENDSDLVIFVTVRVQGEDVVANFQGPLLLNAGNRRGIQLVLDGQSRILHKSE